MKSLATLALLAATAHGGAALAAGMGYDDARHLLTRTGFGATDAEIRQMALLTREQGVASLLANTRRAAVTAPPAWTARWERLPRPNSLGEEDKRALLQKLVKQSFELRDWWLREMLDTPSPLTERMTLFWHNHFVSSQQKVKSPLLMFRQNLLLRSHSTGRFGDLLHAVSKDPAMIIYLDNVSNRKGQPNENFAREVMELFTLGEGHYTESDIKEAARAFTGWSLERDTGEFRFRPFLHDGGSKTVLGRAGRFDGDEVLDILLEQDATARFITAKLWREFVSPRPDPIEVERIAGRFRASRYDLKVALRELLLSPAFWAPENRAVLIKSPVDLVVGTLRTFDVETGELAPFALLTAGLGQNLFAPPNVRGWPGQDDWINSTTLLQRKQFLERLFRAQEMRNENAMMILARAGGQGGGLRGINKLDPQTRERFLRALTDIHFDLDGWLAGLEAKDAGGMQRLLLAMAPVNEVEPGLQGMELIRVLTQDPVYQLK
jgi:uncharacterized protein (DUF1800 family)